ncbi:tannase/feruloyl esterase family alpha/beta hydrolase [Altericroceibacterium spongiae]|uniref:Tannase/feruloyl esterase family alpha/beta hydrolase n=1 Tax=Altericroceibacterium spongiae TaxID=2320269 RepID=A0A420EKC7_9SPHN|nr:tannase/feruloyl esterase family alpha/beta hydrolase [Altericroceibacterium spongiae]RKF21149.1 tannase/feruloyl esterase family alpha/beta hydrolase [Altericroceibacterium spongiae]
MLLRTGVAWTGLLALAACSAPQTEISAPLRESPDFSGTRTASACSSIKANDFGAKTLSTSWVAATPSANLPAYCEVTATLAPAEGSSIGVVYRLPENWNGKMLGLGGGGWAGNVTLESASQGLMRHYATAQTDGGHPGTNPWDTSWTSSAPSVTDFAWRAVHDMTVAGKKLVATYYGNPHKSAYFQGCSTGGRMALMEAQRFPDDYDGIIAGAPVYSLQVQTSAVLRNNLFARPGAAFSQADLQLAQNAALAACDKKDGVADGVIADPQSCQWKPSSLICKKGQTEQCLAKPQAEALEIAYRGIRTSDGSWAMFPLSKGGEAGWSTFNATDGSGMDATGGGGITGLTPLLFGTSSFDYNKMKPDDVLRARSGAFADMYEADDPDLSAFFSKGGKLLLWHGENDPGPSPVGTADYYRAAFALHPAQATENMRYFELPGVEHCQGGPGADMLDSLMAMDRWASSDRAPERLVATKADKSMIRPLCAFPQVPHFQSGDPNDPQNWVCEAPARHSAG